MRELGFYFKTRVKRNEFYQYVKKVKRGKETRREKELGKREEQKES